MKIGPEKYRINTLRKGCWEEHESFDNNEEKIKGMKTQELYKYLKYQQAKRLNDAI